MRGCWRRRRNFAFFLLAVSSWCLSTATATENADNTVSSIREVGPEEAKRQAGTNQPQRHETTVPLLLKGKELRPLNQLKAGSYPASLQLLVRAEGEQLILLLEKNEGLFASHYTETHYQEDGSAVTGAHNFTTSISPTFPLH